MRETLKKSAPALLGLLGLPLLSLALGGCSVSEDMVLLPKTKGLVPLTQLEKHLDYVDPFDSRDSYVLSRGGGR